MMRRPAEIVRLDDDRASPFETRLNGLDDRGPALPEARRRQEFVHELLVSLRVGVLQEIHRVPQCRDSARAYFDE